MRLAALAAAVLAALLAASTASALRVEDARIVDASGSPVALKGVNWFGFNTYLGMVHGLWPPDALSSDFATVVQRQRALGFNAVRLPFSFEVLFNVTPPGDFVHNCTLPTALKLTASVTPPDKVASGSLAPSLPFPPTRTAGKCNDYLPTTTILDRFVWVVQFYVRNGFYVLIDDHLREDQTVLTKGAAAWASQWAQLAAALTAGNTTYDRLIIDVLNEPDNFDIRWEATADRPALKDLLLAAMDAVEAAAPGLLFAIEGTGQLSIWANWGDGFATNASVIASTSISDPRPFFTALLAKPYRDRVVLAPHVRTCSCCGSAWCAHPLPCILTLGIPSL
jgi:aryl-phospho-beta-D-glucosidase BglC (GH1 family)